MYQARSKRNFNNVRLVFEGMEGLEYIVFDTETTGLKPKQDYVVQLSAIKFRVLNHKPQQIDELDIYMKPPFFMGNDVIAVHGITNEFLADKPDEADMLDRIALFFQSGVIVGYNVQFDIAMVQSMFSRHKRTFNYIVSLDVLEMARDIIPPEDTEDYKLGTIAHIYQIDDGIRFHSAIDDVRATARLFEVLYHEYQRLPSAALTPLYINRIYYWKGYNKNQSGVYVDTNMGKIWFSTCNKYWCSTAVELAAYDITRLEKEVLDQLHITFAEFSKMTEKKFDAIGGEKHE